MRRIVGALVGMVVVVGGIGLGAPQAEAAGIVTHAWMGLDAIDRVDNARLHTLLDAHRDQVRAGAEFPDGGYWTRTIGTPGGDYGEEAHWQRFVDAYTAQVRNDPTCAPVTDPAGPCAATIAHLMGVAAHGMGDELFDWLFEPNGPAFGEQYLPPVFAPFVGPGGLELQLDIVAIMRHGRPVGPTPPLPDAGKIDAAFAAVGRADIAPEALPVGEDFLEIERDVEAGWAPDHVDALERAMPWTSAHLVDTAGGVDFVARAIAGYYESIWARLRGGSPRTHVSATAPYDRQANVPATGWTGDYFPGSNAGNSGGLTRIAAALTSSLPYRPLAGQGSLPSELPTGSIRLRDLTTRRFVAPRTGWPRIVPYNPEAGEHTVSFQPATDLAPCRWYEVTTTRSLLDAQLRPVVPARWSFRTSGCGPTKRGAALRGTVTCDVGGRFGFTDPSGATTGGRAQGTALVGLRNCDGGQDGAAAAGAALPIDRGWAVLDVGLAGPACRELGAPTAPATINGTVYWDDASGRRIGATRLTSGAFDVRGTTLTVAAKAGAFASHSLALRLSPDVRGCATDPATKYFPFTNAKVTAWPD